MPQKEHEPKEIVTKLWQVDVLISQGRSVAEAVHSIGMTQFTYYRGRKEFGGLKTGSHRNALSSRTRASRRYRPTPSRSIPLTTVNAMDFSASARNITNCAHVMTCQFQAAAGTVGGNGARRACSVDPARALKRQGEGR